MGWSWFGLLLGLVLPPGLFTAAYIAGIKRETVNPKAIVAVVVGCALIAGLTATLFIFLVAPQWTKGVRIVWHSVRSDNAPLVIGGDAHESVVGWPTNTDTANGVGPTLSVDPTRGNDALLSISGGDGFICDENSHKVLNGTGLTVGETRTFGKYSIRVDARTLRHPLSFELTVLDLSGKKLADFNLIKDSTHSMQYLLQPNLDAAYFTKERAGERDQIEEWSAGIWLLRIDDQQVYVLEKTSKKEVTYRLPANLSLVARWPNRSLPVNLDLERQIATLSFLPPWRFTAALPPKMIEGCENQTNPGDRLKFTVTSRPRPCEIAVALPFGDKQGRVNQEVEIDPVSRKFSSPGAVDNETEVNCPPGAKCEQSKVGLSQFAVRQGNNTFGLAVAEDMPKWQWFAGLLLLAVFFLAWGLWLTSYRFPRTNLWLTYGLVLVVWNFLMFRLILSFRYALDPVALDALAVSGVTRAFFALMIVPGVLLLLARIRCDHYERPADLAAASKAFRRTWAYLLALWVVAFPVSLCLPSRFIWSDLPQSFHPFGLNLSQQTVAYFFALWLVPLILLSIYLVTLYGQRTTESWFLTPWRERPSDDSEVAFSDRLESDRSQPVSGNPTAVDAPSIRRLLIVFFRAALRSMFVSLLLFSPWRWAEQSYFKSTKRASFWNRTIGTWAGFWHYLALFFLIRCLVFLATCYLAKFLIPGDKLVQELAVPVFFYWLALDWIGLALALKTRSAADRTRWEYLRIGLLAIATITIPAIALPILLLDFGSILPVLAILFPLAAILLLVSNKRFPLSNSNLGQKIRNIRDRRTGWAATVAIIAMFAAGYFFYENLTGFLNVPVVRGQSRVFARLLNFKYGSQAQRWALSANSYVGGAGVPFQELLNGNQHTWENKAIAHLGSWSGEGFGNAPSRLSQVRQDTLQYDSAFSFFVVSEYGYVGGALLLIMYCVPLLLILAATRNHFDAGSALAVIVGSSFLLEALYHAGMNWGAFPLTGRNLPLLSVNSPSDLFKWTILFGFVLQTVFWRYRGSGCISDEAESLLPAEKEQIEERDPTEGVRLPGRQFLAATALIVLCPALTLISVLTSGFGVCRDVHQELETFSYKPLLDDVKWYLDNNVIEYAKQSPGAGRQLIPHEEKLNDPDAREFILQEVYRFNYRRPEEQLEAANNEFLNLLRYELGTVHDQDGYNRFLENLRKIRSAAHRPSLFRLHPVRDEEGVVQDYQVEVNDDFNVRFRFHHQNGPRELPQLRYGSLKIIGPGWINGRYSTVIASAEDVAQDKSGATLAELPWIAHMANAMEAEWQRLGAEAATKSYRELTLDQSLQEGAGKFVAERGVLLHRELLARPTKDFTEKLPPRVALSVISLPDGQVRALGSWPRMITSQSDWQKATLTANGEKIAAWIPSGTWLDKDAPIVLKRRYEGDRNFERALVMGSITKPIWASAVMKIHPNLDRLLRVMPSSDEENEVFGLRILGPPWNLNSHVNDWIDFDAFLRYSDNRYQVRTGMLGLAEKEGDGFKASPYPGSPVESLNGQKKPWGKEPQFSSAVTVDRDRNKGTIKRLNLANTDLASYLHDMYSIGIKEQQNSNGRQTRAFGYRRSFWTLDEHDDDSRFESKPTWLLDLISPQAPDFYFDRLNQPRDFITMLLGGGDNRWSNVDLAAGFGSCITGTPVIAHIMEGNSPVRPLDERTSLDPQIAIKIRRGLNEAVEKPGGTAHALWAGDDLGFLKGKVKLYAKTGTLRPEQDIYETSRIVLALIKWKKEEKGEVSDGLIFSVVVEQGKQGTATKWLRDFITENKVEIAKLLKIKI